MPINASQSQSSFEQVTAGRTSLSRTSSSNPQDNGAPLNRRRTSAADERGNSNQSGQSSLSSQSGAGGSLNGEQQSRQPSIHQTSNADYDHIRNTTLMFFLDRLFIASKEGKEARTLHDLSCLFGTRDFTKDMRQIVGASRNGLKKFLQSYPSLFTIEGDRVYLSQLKQEADGASSARDYNKEAVEYFTEKLVQFGVSLVPIRNLFGYRSQASQEVRHVSGKSTKEFKQFLSSNRDTFEILDDKHVVLRSALEELESRGQLAGHQLSSLTYPNADDQLAGDTTTGGRVPLATSNANDDEQIMDPYLNKQLARIIEDCLKRLRDSDNPNPMKDSDRVSIEFLHEVIMKDCNNQLFLKMVNTINDLKVFLRMHPKIFKRFKCDQDQCDYVSLLTEEEQRELSIQGYPSSLLLTRQHSNLIRFETVDSQSDVNQSLKQMNITSQQHDSLPYINKQPMSLLMKNADSSGEPTPVKSTARRSSVQEIETQHQVVSTRNFVISDDDNNNDTHSMVSTTSSHKDECSINGSGHQSGSSSLRATAPPFVPSTRLVDDQRQPKSLQHFTSKHNQEATNGQLAKQLNGQTPGTTYPQVQQMRQVEQRSGIDPHQALRSYLIKASNGNQGNGIYSPNKPSNGAQWQVSSRHNQVAGQQLNDDLRARTISIVREALNIIARIMSTTDAVALDCKGYNLGFNGQITLIQFGFLPTSSKTSSSQNRQHLLDSNKSLNNNESNNAKQQQQYQRQTADGSVSAAASNQKPEVCIFDLITNPELAYCLKPLLESDQIVKIVHDVRNKSNALYSQFGIMLNNVFDTQVANLVIQQQETGKPAYKSRYISIGKLCDIYGSESLTRYRELIKSKHPGSYSSSSSKTKDVNYWCVRPLTESMVYESTMDVYSLVGSVYENLKSRIKPEYLDLFEQLNMEGVLARIKPDEIRSVKKERKVDLEVIDLKRKLYSDTTSSIVLSNREIRLLRHIDLTEEVREKIQQCKKVAKKIERLDMKAAQILQSMNTDGRMESTDDDDQSFNNGSPPQQHSMTPDADKLLNGCNDQENLHQNSNKASTTANEDLKSTNSRLSEMGMSNLMDGSMFDELKDKMIESSSLLESLEDDDETMVAQADSLTVHSGIHSDHDNCRCHCHRGSLDGEKSTSPLNSPVSSTPATVKTETPSTTVENDTKETPDSSVESTTNSGRIAVDMAVQCDLLS